MARTHGESLSALLKGLMDWHLAKINGDPQTEGFDLLLMSDGPGGGVGCKYVLGSFEEAKDRLKADLETTHVGAVMYAYSYKGYWRAPDGAKRDGAIVTVESNELKPAVIGYEIAADTEGGATSSAACTNSASRTGPSFIGLNNAKPVSPEGKIRLKCRAYFF